MDAVSVGAEIAEEVVWDKEGNKGCGMTAALTAIGVAAGLIVTALVSYHLLAPALMEVIR